MFDGLGDMVFCSRGMFCGCGGKGDFDVVVMFDFFKLFCVLKFLEVFG